MIQTHKDWIRKESLSPQRKSCKNANQTMCPKTFINNHMNGFRYISSWYRKSFKLSLFLLSSICTWFWRNTFEYRQVKSLTPKMSQWYLQRSTSSVPHQIQKSEDKKQVHGEKMNSSSIHKQFKCTFQS